MTRSLRVLAAWVTCALVLLWWSGRACALDPEAAEVVLVSSDAPSDELTVLIHAELLALGFAVQRSDANATLAQDAEERGAGAWVRVHTRERETEVWILRDAKDASPRSVVRPSSTEETARSLAMRVTEMIRAALLPQTSAHEATTQGTPKPPASQPPAESPGPSPSAEPPAEASGDGRLKTRPRYAVGLGPVLGYDVDGLSVALRAQLDLAWLLAPKWRLLLSTVVPTFAQSVSATEGSADVRATFAHIGVQRLLLADDAARWVPRVGIASGASLVQVSGKANEPNRSRTQSQFAATALLTLGLTLRVRDRVGLALDGVVGIASPRSVVRFAGREVGSLGRPLSWTTLSVEVPFG